LNSLNADIVASVLNNKGIDNLPKLHFEHDGWNIEFFPIPKDSEYRGKDDSRPIGIQAPEIKWINDRTVILQALLKKAGRYGDIDKPYVIAVNSLPGCSDDGDITDALFGSEKYLLTFVERNLISTEASREQNGLWIGPQGTQNTRVSAVLACYEIYPWSIHSKGIRLFHNPWAKLQYNGILNDLPKAMVNESGKLEFSAGIHPRKYLGIPENWIYQDCE
jgi:hypothetical protein